MTTHPLITTLVGGFVGAFIFGMVAKRLALLRSSASCSPGS